MHKKNSFQNKKGEAAVQSVSEMAFRKLRVPVCGNDFSDTRWTTASSHGYADMQAGRTKSAAQVFADIRRDYNV